MAEDRHQGSPASNCPGGGKGAHGIDQEGTAEGHKGKPLDQPPAQTPQE